MLAVRGSAAFGLGRFCRLLLAGSGVACLLVAAVGLVLVVSLFVSVWLVVSEIVCQLGWVFVFA